MGVQLHKKFDDAFIQSILEKYISRDLSVKQVCDILQLERADSLYCSKSTTITPQCLLLHIREDLRGESAESSNPQHAKLQQSIIILMQHRIFVSTSRTRSSRRQDCSRSPRCTRISNRILYQW
jgi:hypothetical protein